MTTPAIERHNTTTKSSVVCTRRVSPPPSTPFDCRGRTLQVIAWDDESRPASGNSAMIGHFRVCREWSHDIRDVRRKLLTDSHQRTDSFSGIRAETRAEDGSYWSTASPPLSALPPSTNMVNRVVTEALSRLKRQDIHLGNFLAEFRKTQQMVVRAGTTIGRQVQSWRGRNPKLWPVVTSSQIGNLPRHLWCKIPDTWLELQYGWKPLLSDVLGAASHLSKVSRKNSPFVFASAQFGDEEVVSTTVPGTFGGADCTYRWRHERSAQCQLVYKINSPVLAELSSLGLVNPLEIVWETTRYSFVVDWLLPVSTWLSAISGAAGMDFVTGTISQRSRATYDGCVVIPRPSYDVSSGGPEFTGHLMRFRRSCLSGTPFPGLYLKNPVSGAHVINALALLAQAFR